MQQAGYRRQLYVGEQMVMGQGTSHNFQIASQEKAQRGKGNHIITRIHEQNNQPGKCLP